MFRRKAEIASLLRTNEGREREAWLYQPSEVETKLIGSLTAGRSQVASWLTHRAIPYLKVLNGGGRIGISSPWLISAISRHDFSLNIALVLQKALELHPRTFPQPRLKRATALLQPLTSAGQQIKSIS